MAVRYDKLVRVARSAKLTYILLFLVAVAYWRSGTRTNEEPVVQLIEKTKEGSDKGSSKKVDEIAMQSKWFKGLKTDRLCPDYVEYSKQKHPPYSTGPLKLAYMRPSENCRTFSSEAVESVIEDMRARIQDPDLFRLFENAFPNTLDTTVLWHDPLNKETKSPLTFISTGDIHAEWLRDSARQLSVYLPLVKKDPKLKTMIEGAIIQQALYIRRAPYCNAFQPPQGSNVDRKPSSIDFVGPRPPWKHVFECKWELDSLASFLTLSNGYYKHSKDFSIFNNPVWQDAFQMILVVLHRESSPTFDDNGDLLPFYYTFQRDTRSGTETLGLSGSGNPVRGHTGLVRSAFRPSDDACIYQLFIPANAQMQVELSLVEPVLRELGLASFADQAAESAAAIREGIRQYGVVDHKTFGKVLAYEVDGFGGVNIMDDANIPSLLALPDMGFVDQDDEIYQNTRRMILSKDGNPYYFKGAYFEGIGGPHIGLSNAWPMSLLLQIRTTDDDEEIRQLLDLVKTTTAGLGLMHESIHVNSPRHDYTRPWFSWCNSEFGKTILDLAHRKPHLIFGPDRLDPYVV
ncbi:hypothetical protein OGAPHI_003915 [Ogataea philodendri]|uniref:Uncharacterized protein n=1 Tax=Ogataea philodendri TaxID=1378263 RepID=A0A9P8P6B7_9ASCO|nr:uncharacterized protein OGAPHI_003915 [Ogataea philodendri]KAH3665727.1 hypothetical protein OGAPHI_003915 [Ogataea philodendri]